MALKSAINAVTDSNIEAAPTSVSALAVLRSIEASRFRFNRRGKMVSTRQLGWPLFPRPCDSHDTDSDRRQGAGTVWGAREQRARTDLVDNVKNPQFNLRALFRLRDRCPMMYCQRSL